MEAASIISPATVKNGKFSLLNGVNINYIFICFCKTINNINILKRKTVLHL